jgi:uncharacterized membrane protein YkoI
MNSFFNIFYIALKPMTFSLLLVSCLLTVNPIVSFADKSQDIARKLSASGQILPLEIIYEKAQAIKSGKILEAELEVKGRQYIYEVELLDDNGLVWEIELDAKTGKLIKMEED